MELTKEIVYQVSIHRSQEYNHFYNILSIFDILTSFCFTTSEMMRDYYL